MFLTSWHVHWISVTSSYTQLCLTVYGRKRCAASFIILFAANKILRLRKAFSNMPNSWRPSTNPLHSHVKGLLTRLIIWKCLIKVYQICHFCQIHHFSHVSLLWGALIHPILSSTFSRKVCLICHLSLQIRRVCLIRQLSGAFLAKLLLFAWILLSTALAKFRQNCYFAEYRRFWHVRQLVYLL